jgi:hypothetical protein
MPRSVDPIHEGGPRALSNYHQMILTLSTCRLAGGRGRVNIFASRFQRDRVIMAEREDQQEMPGLMRIMPNE